MPRFNGPFWGEKPLKMVTGSTPESYVSDDRFAIAHGFTNSVGEPRTPDVYFAVEGATDPYATQSLAITGTPTGGTFTITYDGQTTAAIAYNAAAADVEDALQALTNLGTAVTCSGGALPGTAVSIAIDDSIVAPALMTTTDSLTGGTTPASAITVTKSMTHVDLAVISADETNVYLTADDDIAIIYVYVG